MFEKSSIRISGIISVQFFNSHRTVGHRYRFGETKNAELIYKLGGKNNVHFGDRSYTENRGTVRYLPAHSKNSDYYVDIISAGSCIDIYFDTDCDMPGEMICEDFPDNKKLEGYFRRIQRLWLLKADGYEYECLALAYRILAELSREKKYVPDKHFEKLSPALEYISEHCFERDFSCTALSEQCGLSYSYIKRLFTEKFGMPPVRYVATLRMRKARELLMTNQYTVTEIAALCGYENVYYFSRAFKEHFGTPPSEYK